MQAWNFKIQFPTDSNFINRITSFSFGESKSSDNPMYTMECEVITPTSVNIGGEDIEIAGVKTLNYYTTKVIGDEEKSAKCLERLTGTNPERPGILRILLGAQADELLKDFNPENPNPEIEKAIKGKCILTMMSPEIVEQRKNPTLEQIEEAKKKKKRAEGDVMKHPVTGKPLVGYRPLIREVFCLAPEGAAANRPY